MKEQDFRIGIWVNYDNKDCQITLEDFSHIIKYDIQLIQPILITEEWLLKLNFNNQSFSYFEFPDHDLSHFVISGETYGWNVYINGRVVATIRYVHQAQNIYYALTGKELILNNK